MQQAILAKWAGWRLGRTGLVEFAALAALGLFMAGVDAFHAGDGGPAMLVPYWLAGIIGGGVIAAVIEPWIAKAPPLSGRPRLFAVAQIVAMTFPITLYIWLLSAVMFSDRLDPDVLTSLFPRVLLVDIAVVLIAWVLRGALHPRLVALAPTAPREANPLSTRLPPKLARANLLAVEAEDHYLRVHTEAGEALVYMRFNDALIALEAGDGLRVHRSWWVARKAVDLVRWRAGRGELALSNGVKVPVSRTYAGAVRAAAWVEDAAVS